MAPSTSSLRLSHQYWFDYHDCLELGVNLSGEYESTTLYDGISLQSESFLEDNVRILIDEGPSGCWTVSQSESITVSVFSVYIYIETPKAPQLYLPCTIR